MLLDPVERVRYPRAFVSTSYRRCNGNGPAKVAVVFASRTQIERKEGRERKKERKVSLWQLSLVAR